jgi:SagB-type dehydrogenase family enzyme
VKLLNNSESALAREYHQSTANIREVSSLDYENRPFPYKVYSGLTPTELRRTFPRPSEDTVRCVASTAVTSAGINFGTLTELLYFSAGITKTFRHPSGELFDLRAAACTGARYEIETYVVCGDMPGLASGAYHFNPKDFALRQLRTGDFRPYLYEATGENGDILSSPICLMLSAIHWRNSWKYQARAFRHFFWDSGTIVANLLATAVSERLGARVVLAFIDKSINHLLGLSLEDETATAIVTVGTQPNADNPSRRPMGPIPPLSLEHVQLSKRQVQYPEILRMHNASALDSPQEVKAWRENTTPKLEEKARTERFALSSISSPETKSLGNTIIRRGSTRRYAREPISLGILSAILRTSTNDIPADFLNPKGSTLLETYVIINAVENLPAGAYYYNRREQALEFLKRGDFREMAGHLCLDQALGSDCSAALFLMSNLDSVLSTYGNRGYRAAQLEAGIVLGKMNLCAYALEVGASGITFYDDAVTEFFSPHAKGKSNMISVTLGIPGYGRRHRVR